MAGAIQLPPGFNFEQTMATEDLTNAVWSRILHDCFRGPRYIISPEYNFDGRRRADLVVIDLQQRNNVLVAFEGKKHGGAAMTFSSARQQALDCLKGGFKEAIAIAALGQKFNIVGIDEGEVKKWKMPTAGSREKDPLISENLDKIAAYLTAVAERGVKVIQ